jgi:WD40 repeat protein
VAITESVEQALPEQKARRPRLFGLDGPRTGIDLSPNVGVIQLLDTETGKDLRRLTVVGSKPWAMAFSPDGKTLAATTGWDSGQIHCFDFATGKETGTVDAPPLHSPALAFTPDGSRLVTGMADGSILVWDVQTGR